MSSSDKNRHSKTATILNRIIVQNMQCLPFIEAPKVTVTPQKSRIKTGESAEFTCIASGSPSPKLSWRKFNGSLPVSGTMRGGVLSIANVTQEDAGIYLCEASNVEGSAEGNGTLEIEGIVYRKERQTR